MDWADAKTKEMLEKTAKSGYTIWEPCYTCGDLREFDGRTCSVCGTTKS